MNKINQWKLKCPYCGELTKSGHYVPPSLGDPGFAACEDINRYEQAAGMKKEKDWSKKR